jgi:thiamine-monophosphate kinase
MPLSEKKLIQKIRSEIRRYTRNRKSLVTGIGDDCAVLRVSPGRELLVTTDFSIENVHFRRQWHGPELVGRRCLTRGLSDIAAMGGEPLAAFLSLAIPNDLPQKWVTRFLRGLLDLAQEFAVPLAGGDTAQSLGGIQADIVVVGSVPRGQAILRSGAKPGDHLYVTGELGGAAAALERLRESKSKPLGAKLIPHLSALPRVAVGKWLRQRRMASAMIDLSDGVSTDLEHICAESRVGAEIDEEAIPRARVGRGKGNDRVAMEFALHGGDDYELLFASSAAVPSKIAGVPVTRIGRVTRSTGMRLIGSNRKPRVLKPGGWEHFTGNL